MTLRKILPLILVLFAGLALADDIVVIGDPALPKLNVMTIQKIFTGRIVEVDGLSITPVNAVHGTTLRSKFFAAYLGQDEDKYTAYWTVRRFIGKGVPPKDIENDAGVINYVQSHPGAVGYINAADLRPGLNVLSRK